MRRNGILTWWHLAPEFDRKTVQERFIALGFEKERPDPASDVRTLGEALRDVYKRPTIIRSLQNAKGYRVVQESGNDYDVVLTAKLTTDGKLDIEAEEKEAEEEVRKRWKHWLSILGNEEFARSLVAVLRKLGGIYMRPMGAVYWLPRESVQRWDQVVRVVENSATYGKSLIATATFVDDERGHKALRDAMGLEVSAAVALIVKRASNPMYRERFLQARLKEIRVLKHTLHRYETAIREKLPDSRRECKVAEETILALGRARFPGVF